MFDDDSDYILGRAASHREGCECSRCIAVQLAIRRVNAGQEAGPSDYSEGVDQEELAEHAEAEEAYREA